MGDLTLFEALASGVFDHLNCQHIGKFDQNFSKKAHGRGSVQSGGGGGSWAVLGLTGVQKCRLEKFRYECTCGNSKIT